LGGTVSSLGEESGVAWPRPGGDAQGVREVFADSDQCHEFLRGDAFTPAKQRRQQSPYRHLLRPKAGGIALALNAMGDKFQAILDVTIVYPDGVPNFWAFLCGRVACVRVRARRLPVPTHLVKADYASDPAVREAFQQWLQQIWQEKDRQIDALLAQRSC